MNNGTQLNILNFTDNYTEVIEQRNNCLLLSSNNRLTGFFVDISNFVSKDLADITITLRGCDDIDFKTVVDSNQLLTDDNYLYFKNSKPFLTTVSGIYILEVTDDANILYSYPIFFDESNNYSLTGDLILLYVSGNISFKLVGSGNVVVDFGNGTISTYSLPQTISYTGTTSIIKISNGYNITDFTCNSSNLTKIENTKNFTSLENLDVSDTSLTAFDFSQITTLESVDISGTEILTDINTGRFTLSEIIEFTSDEVNVNSTKLVQTLYDSCEILSIQNAGLTSISNSYYSQYYTKLKNINLSGNRFILIPRLGLNGFNLVSPVEELILQNNDLRCDLIQSVLDYEYCKPYLAGVTSKLDFKNNAIPFNYIDLILRYVYENNPNLNGLYLDLSGASPISGISMGIPSDSIWYYSINYGGLGYAVNDILNVTDGDISGSGAAYKVTEVDVNGAIVRIKVLNRGSGYNAVENFTGGSGQWADIEFYSPRVALVRAGVELYTNAIYDVELIPENAILDSLSKKYIKDTDFLTW